MTRQESWDSVVGRATGYELDHRGVGVRVPLGAKFFSSPRRPNWFWCPPTFLMLHCLNTETTLHFYDMLSGWGLFGAFFMFVIRYLTTRSASRPHCVDVSTINEYGAVYGMRIGRGNRRTHEKKNLPQCHFVDHESHMTWHGMKPGPPLWETHHTCYDAFQTTDWFLCYLTRHFHIQGYIEWDEMRKWLWMVSRWL
jgi:hypothetical protein